jgi:hypothetical protein
MRPARSPLPPARVEGDELVEYDVPATVVCARCGNAECPGCVNEVYRSGIIAVVPWERLGVPVSQRLWATARAATFDAERFFESMPDGPIDSALGFAVASEMIAVTTMAIALMIPLGILAPVWMKHVLTEQWGLVLRLLVAGAPLVGLLLVAAHVTHGWALHFGARVGSPRSAGRRALRFGLYAAGWDLVIGPLGALIAGFKEGPGAAISIVGLASGLPTRSAKAFLKGCYGLTGDAARPALRASTVAAVLVTLVGAAVVIAAIGWAAFL